MIALHCPVPPDWTLDWQALRDRFDFVNALHNCRQDPEWHSEGDVGIHTEMACRALVESSLFRALPAAERQIVFAAVLLHDVAKPMCTKEEDNGRITSRGHSNRGEVFTRELLWAGGMSFASREAICALIRHHQVPFFLVDRDDAQRLAFRVSQLARCDHLALVAWADAFGRRCKERSDRQQILDNVELFREFCSENDCLNQPRQFPSDHSRFLYFRKDDRDPSYLAHDDTGSSVVLMSGLPGSGKDSWVKNHLKTHASSCGRLEVISLDEIRRQLKVDPSAPQGRVIEAGRNKAREFLRAKQDFIWNATNLSRSIRDQLITLFADYKARVRIQYVEVGPKQLAKRNREREHPVPWPVITRLLTRWTLPSLVEAHGVDYTVACDLND